MGRVSLLVLLSRISQAAARDGIFMIDAARALSKTDQRTACVRWMCTALWTFISKAETSLLRGGPMAEILEQDHNLNLPRYIASNKAEDVQDIDAHPMAESQADIDALGDLAGIYQPCQVLRRQRGGVLSLNAATDAISDTISSHADYKAFEAQVAAHYQAWQGQVVEGPKALQIGMKPKQEKDKLAEGLLDHYSSQPR